MYIPILSLTLIEFLGKYRKIKGEDCKKIYKSIDYHILNDINKLYNSNKVIVFLEDFKLLNKKNKYFILEKDSLQIINPTKDNLNLMQLFEEIDIYDVLREMYNWGEVLLADYELADYMVKDYSYIINMPFIDTNKLDKLRKMNNREKCIRESIDIITLSENTEKIREIIGIDKFNIVELDKWIEYMKEQIRIEANLDKFLLENYGI